MSNIKQTRAKDIKILKAQVEKLQVVTERYLNDFRIQQDKIVEQADQIKQLEEVDKLLPNNNRYMYLPDGGSPSIAIQLGMMIEDIKLPIWGLPENSYVNVCSECRNKFVGNKHHFNCRYCTEKFLLRANTNSLATEIKQGKCITELKAKLKAAQSQWPNPILVKEGLPKFGVRVLALDEGGFGWVTAQLGFAGWYLEGEIDKKCNITKWIPLLPEGN